MPLKGNVNPHWRPNRDGSRTYYIRWKMEGDERFQFERVGRTGPKSGPRENGRMLREARLRAMEKQHQLTAPEDEAAPRRKVEIALNDALAWYSGWLRGDKEHPPQCASSTADERERIAQGFIDFVAKMAGKRTVWALSRKDTGRWREDRRDPRPNPLREFRNGHHRKRLRGKVIPSTLIANCSSLQDFLDFCNDQGWMPARLIVLPKHVRRKITPPRKPPPLIMEGEEVRAVIAAGKTTEARAGLWLLAATGMRSGELVSLRVGSWLGDRGILRIPAGDMERTKRHGRDIPVGSETARLLDSLCEERYHEYWLFHQADETPLPVHAVGQWMRQVPHTPHDFRRFFYSTLLEAGMPLPWLKMLMGHSLSKVEAAYTGKPTLSRYREWMEKIEGILLR